MTTNRILASISVEPLYGQVVVRGEESLTYPDFVTGDEDAVWTQDAVLIATRADTDGDVTIAVSVGASSAELGKVVFEGHLELGSGLLLVGSDVSGVLDTVRLPYSGKVSLRILVSEDGASVTVLLPPGESGEVAIGGPSTDRAPVNELHTSDYVDIPITLEQITAGSVLISRWTGRSLPELVVIRNMSTNERRLVSIGLAVSPSGVAKYAVRPWAMEYAYALAPEGE